MEVEVGENLIAVVMIKPGAVYFATSSQSKRRRKKKTYIEIRVNMKHICTLRSTFKQLFVRKLLFNS